MDEKDKQKFTASIRDQIILDYTKDQRLEELPVCNNCEEYLVPIRLEDPDFGGFWNVWMCGCKQDAPHSQDGSLTVWSRVMDEKRINAGLPCAHDMDDEMLNRIGGINV